MTPEELITWRSRNGYSQAKLAKALGIHVMTISKWERGVHRKEIPPFLRLALERLECVEGGEQTQGATKTEKEEP
jgi:transcriptional regulator with XRE-family HTH domain